jgi:hypothetical protein
MELSDWDITAKQKKESQENFFALTNGGSMLTADVVKDNFVNILPATDLFEIWTLSDLDLDGSLNEKEFIIFQFLINARLGAIGLPDPSQFKTLLSSLEALLVPNNELNHASPSATVVDASTNQLPNGVKITSNSHSIDELFELPLLNPIVTWESFRVNVPTMTAEDYKIYGLSNEPIPRHDIAPQIIKVGLITTIEQGSAYWQECEKIFQQHQLNLEEQGKIHKNIIEKGTLIHSELVNIEQQALQCHNYISHQYQECLLAEAQLKEAKGNLHALLHIAKHTIQERRANDQEYIQLVNEKERLSKMLQQTQ